MQELMESGQAVGGMVSTTTGTAGGAAHRAAPAGDPEAGGAGSSRHVRVRLRELAAAPNPLMGSPEWC